MSTEPTLMSEAATDPSCWEDPDCDNSSAEASPTPCEAHDPLHDVGWYIPTADGEIPCPDSPSLPSGTVQAVRRALRYAIALLLHPQSLPIIVDTFVLEHASQDTRERIEGVIRDTLANVRWTIAFPSLAFAGSIALKSSYARYAISYRHFNTYRGRTIYLSESLLFGLWRAERAFPSVRETDDVDLLARDISPDLRFRHAWRLAFTGTVIAHELLLALGVFMCHEVYNDPPWPRDVISQLRHAWGRDTVNSSTFFRHGDNVWGSRLFGGELCVFQMPKPPDPGMRPITDFDPKAPPKKRPRRSKCARPPSPEPLSLQERYLEHLKALQALPNVEASPKCRLAIGKNRTVRGLELFPISDEWVLKSYEAFLHDRFDEVTFPPPVEPQPKHQETVASLRRSWGDIPPSCTRIPPRFHFD